jgi:hypothetical protein
MNKPKWFSSEAWVGCMISEGRDKPLPESGFEEYRREDHGSFGFESLMFGKLVSVMEDVVWVDMWLVDVGRVSHHLGRRTCDILKLAIDTFDLVRV